MNASDPLTPDPSTSLSTDPATSRGGSGGSAFIFFLFLLLAGGAVYYFAFYKPGLTPGVASAVAATAPSPGAARPASPNATGYTSAQREQYVRQSEDSFKAQRQTKSQAFTDAYSTLMKSGGFTAEGLTSKDAIEARRALIAQCQTANDEYELFIRDQESTYKTELKKTPLTPDDVDYVSSDFAAKANTAGIIKLRDAQRDNLKTGDDMMAYADRTFGSWQVSGKNFSFKKAADSKEYVALAQKYNAGSAALQKLKTEINATNTDPSGAAGPGGSPAAAPASSPLAAAPAAPAAAPTAAASASPVASQTP